MIDKMLLYWHGPISTVFISVANKVMRTSRWNEWMEKKKEWMSAWKQNKTILGYIALLFIKDIKLNNIHDNM